MRSFPLLSLFLVVPAFAQAEEVLDLRDAVGRALESNHDLKIAKERVEQSEAEMRLAVGGLFPSLTGNLGVAYRKDAVASGQAAFGGRAYNNYAGSFDLTQPLLRGSALWDGVAYYRKLLERQRLDYEIAERDQVLNVVQAFYQVLVAQKKLDSYTRQESALKILLGRAQQRYNVGAERLLTVLQFRTQLALTSPQLVEARNQLETSGVVLLNLLGDRQSSEIRVKGDLDEAIDVPVDPAVFGQELERPELRRERIEQEAFDRNRGVLMAEHWPALNLVGSLGRSGTTGGSLFDADATTWSVGLNLSVPLFTGLSSFKKREVLASQWAQLIVQEKRTRDQVTLQRLQAARDFDTVSVVLKARREALDLARQAFASAQRMYGLGTVTYSTLFETQNTLIESELAYSQTQYDYLVRLAQKYVAYGKPLKDFIAKTTL
jgi:outer membrane protein TolC